MSDADDVVDLINGMDLDFERYLRIGVTADGDYFVQVVELSTNSLSDANRFAPTERVIAESDGPLLTALRNVHGMIQDPNYRVEK